MMTAIENGFDVPQFSESITDPRADGSCGAGSKEIYFIIQSPFAGLDTFSYGVTSTTDHRRVTKIRRSGGSLLSPLRYVTVKDGPVSSTYDVKFPMRLGNLVQYDCYAAASAPSFGALDAWGFYNYEAAYKVGSSARMTVPGCRRRERITQCTGTRHTPSTVPE